MIVPRYWAEGRLRHRDKERQITVRRLGWSDESESAAQAVADERTRVALERALAGETLARREPKIPYNGAEGVPIREEIVSRHGETVITRNSYGALCLNTPNVMFVDIDFDRPVSMRLSCIGFVIAVAASRFVMKLTDDRTTGIALALLVIVLAWVLPLVVQRTLVASRGGPNGVARRRIERFVRRHPEWGFRIYGTPKGLRVLAMHQTFAPDDPDVTKCFAALGADPIYSRMCQNQKCFRARLTAKPWRIGIQSHMRPRPGTWPVKPEHRARRDQWIAEYEKAAAGFAACTYLETVGSNLVDSSVRAVQELHDRLCKSDSKLPIA